jgi:hypothetical protein
LTPFRCDFPGVAASGGRENPALTSIPARSQRPRRTVRQYFGNAPVRRLWFGQVLQSALVPTVLEVYRGFGVMAAAALEIVAARSDVALSKEASSEILGGMRALPRHPEARGQDAAEDHVWGPTATSKRQAKANAGMSSGAASAPSAGHRPPERTTSPTVGDAHPTDRFKLLESYPSLE